MKKETDGKGGKVYGKESVAAWRSIYHYTRRKGKEGRKEGDVTD